MKPLKTIRELMGLQEFLYRASIDIEIGDILLEPHDYGKLRIPKWLNNKIIMAYLELIRLYGKGKNINIISLSTYFFPDILNDDYTSHKTVFDEFNVFNCEFIIIPVHLYNHWTICIIDVKSKIFEYYDSMYSKSEFNLDVLRKIRYGIYTYTKNEDLNTFKLIDKSNKINKQDNSFDCGVFCCYFARFRIESDEINILQPNSKILRLRMLHEIIRKEIIYAIDHVFVSK